MSKNHTWEVVGRLQQVGIREEHALSIRRIAMTLSRWSELECGDANGHAIERDDVTGKPYLTYDRGDGGRGRYPVADRETGALKRLDKIIRNYPGLSYYVQSDPRGAPLYILRPGDIPEGKAMDSYYSRGIAVYK